MPVLDGVVKLTPNATWLPLIASGPRKNGVAANAFPSNVGLVLSSSVCSADPSYRYTPLLVAVLPMKAISLPLMGAYALIVVKLPVPFGDGVDVSAMVVRTP